MPPEGENEPVPRTLTALLLCAGLASCAAARPVEPGAPVSADAYDGAIVASVVATPFYALAKATTCVATTLIAAPSSAALALTDRVQRDYQRQALHEGIGRNCKGAYYLPPVY